MTNIPEEITQKIEKIVREVIDQVIPLKNDNTVPIGISARHMHITPEHFEKLFGPGKTLTKLKDLLQPGEFAANETVAIMGPNRRIFGKVRILGPMRDISQVELSFTDGVYLGMDLPHRISGDIKGSAPITVIGPEGVLRLPEGAIRAMRHVHMNPDVAERLGLKAGDKIDVRTIGPARITYNDVVIRIKEKLLLQMHVDTDEANAAGLDPDNAYGEMII